MSEQRSFMEDSVRDAFVMKSADVPNRDELRRHILSTLEGEPVIRRWANSDDRLTGKHPWLLALGVAASLLLFTVLAQGIAAPSDNLNTIQPSGLDIPSSREALLGRYDTDEFRQELTLAPPAGPEGFWRVLSENESTVSLSYSNKIRTESSQDRLMYIVSPPPGTPSNEIVDTIESTLFDTEILGDSAGELGGRDSRRLHLQTSEGTTHLSFQVTPEVYIETDGSDRSFVVHITDSGRDTLVFWIEASPDEIGDFEDAADKLVRSMSLN